MSGFEYLEFCQHRLSLAAEAGEIAAWQWLRWQTRNRQRIAVLTVDAKFVMHMRAGCEAGHADKADRLPLRDMLTDLLTAEA